MQSLPKKGAMLVVFEGAGRVQSLLPPFGEQISIAAINGSSQTVVSGMADSIAQFRNRLEQDQIYCKDLGSAHAFHSSLMTPVLEPLAQVVGSVALHSPKLRLFSDLLGREANEEFRTARYWRDHAREPVRFGDALQAMHDGGCRLLVEISADLTFSNLAYRDETLAMPLWFPSLRKGLDDRDSLLDSLAGLYTHGVSLDWQALDGKRQLSQVQLPAYRFERTRYWHDDPGFVDALMPTQATVAPERTRGQYASERMPTAHPLLGQRMRLPGSEEIRFESWFSTFAPHFIEDHRLFGIPVVPGASHFAMLAQASATLAVDEAIQFEELILLKPLVLPDSQGRHVQLILKPDSLGWVLELTSAAVESQASVWTTHLIGKARRRPLQYGNQNAPPLLDLKALKTRMPLRTSGSDFYTKIWANQGGTGTAFRWIDSIWHGGRESLCLTQCPPSITDSSQYRVHPGLVEAACQVLHCCAEIERAEDLIRDQVTYVPFSVDQFYIAGAMANSSRWWCHARMRELSTESVLADLCIYSESGELIAELKGFCLRRIFRKMLKPSDAALVTPVAPVVAGAIDVHANDTPAIEARATSRSDLARYLREKCAELSGTSIETIDLERGFIEIGLDSLSAVNLVNQLRRTWKLNVRVSEVLASTSLNKLAGNLFDRMSQKAS
jgi:acyl transferase domain-containing protein